MQPGRKWVRRPAIRLVTKATIRCHPLNMRSLLVAKAIVVVLVCLAASSALAAPITKQNGSDPVFQDFTSICSVPGYVNFGWCGGDATKFTNITGKVNTVQAK